MQLLFTEIANRAVDALLEEAYLAPKPGLVDARNNGSHSDMDITLFEKSAHAFRDGFIQYIQVGYEHDGDYLEALAKIRILGMEIEEAMFSATGGTNTHKGANFSFGVVLTALGLHLKDSNAKLPLDESDLEQIATIIRHMTKDLVANDFKDIDKKEHLTYGETLYVKHGISGIRQEAEDGYPTVFSRALPIILQSKKTGGAMTASYLEALYTIMTTLDDSNIISRGGLDALSWCKATAQAFLNSGGVMQEHYTTKLCQIDDKFIAKNLSPGGAADLLALTIFLSFLLEENHHYIKRSLYHEK